MLTGLKASSLSIVITDKDRREMEAIPAARRATIMHRAMRGRPMEERHFAGNTNYVRAILKLRASGLRLIDLHQQETAFVSVWYRKGASVLGLTLSEAIALMVWELGEHAEELTTIRIWRR